MTETAETFPVYDTTHSLIGWIAEGEVRRLIKERLATVICSRHGKPRRIYMREGASENDLRLARLSRSRRSQASQTVFRECPDPRERNGIWWWSHKRWMAA